MHGTGPPLVIATCWLSHLQFDWESPVWRHFLAELGQFATIMRYDERGHGLSDADVEDFRLQARVADLEAVVEARGRPVRPHGHVAGWAGLDRVSVGHPERVTRLLFYGSYATALRITSTEDLELDDAYQQMIKVGWARPDSEFRRVFTSLMIPDATETQMRWLDDLQRVSVSTHTAYLARQHRMRADVAKLLPRLRLPTLVLHSREDRMRSFEDARVLTAGIPGARLVPLESNNHILLADEPAWPVFREEVAAFLEPDRCRPLFRGASMRQTCCRRANSTCCGWRRTATTTKASRGS